MIQRSLSIRANVFATTSAPREESLAGSVCVAVQTTRVRINPLVIEMDENPLYHDKDYRGLHRWEVA